MPRMAIAYTIGCLLLAGLPQLPGARLAVGLVIAGLTALVCRQRFITCACLGFYVAWVAAAGWLDDVDAVQAMSSRDRVDCVVIGLPRETGGHVSFDCQLVNPSTLADKKLRLSWFAPGVDVSPGQAWRFSVHLQVLKGFQNAGGFDAELNALNQRIVGRGRVVGAEQLAGLLKGRATIDQWRAAAADAIAARSVTSQDASAVARALGLGDRRGIGDDMDEVLRTTGTAHVLAVSGLHVALAAGLGFLSARGLAMLMPSLLLHSSWRLAGPVMGLLSATAYALVTGLSLPSQRALTMLGLLLIGQLIGRAHFGSQRLGAAVLVLLSLDPLAVLDRGFWLSIAAVAILIFWSSGRAKGGVGALLSLQVTVVGLMSLLGASMFGGFALVAPVANLLVLPWLSLSIMPLIVFGSMLTIVDEGAGHVVLVPAIWQLEWMIELLRWLSALPHAWIETGHVPAWVGGVTVIAGSALLLPARLRMRVPAVVILSAAIAGNRSAIPYGEMRLDIFDVGAGNAALIRTRDHALLFDAGFRSRWGSDRGGTVILPALRALGVDALDGVFIASNNAYHGGGLMTVIDRYPVPRRWLASAGSGAIRCVQGQSWIWNGVYFEVVYPGRFIPVARSQADCALRVRAGATTILMTGDLSSAAVNRLALERVVADVVLAPNHGRHDPSFLVRPGGAVLVTPPHRRSNIQLKYSCLETSYCSVHEVGITGHLTVTSGNSPGGLPFQISRALQPRWWHRVEPLSATSVTH